MIKKVPTSRGFCLLEVLVTTFIVASALVGLMAMQGVIKKSTYASKQRTQATFIAQSIMESLKINRSVLKNAANLDLLKSISQSAGSLSEPTCSSCSPQQRLEADIVKWQHHLTGSNVKRSAKAIAGLSKADACITHDLATGNTMIVVSWHDRTESKDARTASGSECGTDNVSRRQLVLKSTILQA
ncbi:hypothetical protein D1Z90_07290 [Motilimonas pumila]|uniref:Type IV pilus modification protein PilV n=2 Tax=Motilimonas pumila TaxID=2303987 RepID=A0A418YG81_9GAMM|nr:hypothetical protein D1Z90_07290 [Motilimonas pumila]